MLTIAVLGYGRVGRSVVTTIFATSTGRKTLRDTIARLHRRHEADVALQFVVWDQRHLEPLEHAAIIKAGGVVADQPVSELIAQADYCIVSPGVDAAALGVPKEKHIAELDLFCTQWQRPWIGVTGSLGKTSVVSMLTDVLGHLHEKQVVCGGNIGRPMLDLLPEQKQSDVALLELSSFQLEHIHNHLPPAGAILTNLFENHLDRHQTVNNYLNAKLQLWRAGMPEWSVLPVQAHALLAGSDIWQQIEAATVYWVAVTADEAAQWRAHTWPATHHLIAVDGDRVVLSNNDDTLLPLGPVPAGMRIAHAVTVYAAVYALQGASACQLIASAQVTAHEHYRAHRLEKCFESHGVTFYNDSKATIYQATIAAVQQLAQHGTRLHLIVGGCNKGVDRTPLVDALNEVRQLVQVVAYGAPDDAFVQYEQYPSLCQAVCATMRGVRPGDIVLFSPSGTSFDRFRHYQERGDAFVRLVQYYASIIQGDQALGTTPPPHEQPVRPPRA